MNNPSKLKMSIPKFRAITIPVMAIFLVFALVLTVVTDYFTPSLDAFWGKGNRTATVSRRNQWLGFPVLYLYRQ